MIAVRFEKMGGTGAVILWRWYSLEWQTVRGPLIRRSPRKRLRRRRGHTHAHAHILHCVLLICFPIDFSGKQNRIKYCPLSAINGREQPQQNSRLFRRQWWRSTEAGTLRRPRRP